VLLYFLLLAQKKVTKKRAANSIGDSSCVTLRCELAFVKIFMRIQVGNSISFVRCFLWRCIRRLWLKPVSFSLCGE
jgi:hypothetical protein